jgi:hypothetical protein
VLFSDGAVHISGDSVSTEWRRKSVTQWVSDDILCWIISVANDNYLNTEDINMTRFIEIDGTTLYKMSEADFVAMDSQFGRDLYYILQRLKQEQDQQMADKCEFFCKYTLCEGSLHVACSVQIGKMGLAALVCCDVMLWTDLIFVSNFCYKRY